MVTKDAGVLVCHASCEKHDVARVWSDVVECEQVTLVVHAGRDGENVSNGQNVCRSEQQTDGATCVGMFALHENI